jgi:hypothetical protein
MKEADKKQTCFTVNVISNNLKSKFKYLLQKKKKKKINKHVYLKKVTAEITKGTK